MGYFLSEQPLCACEDETLQDFFNIQCYSRDQNVQPYLADDWSSV